MAVPAPLSAVPDPSDIELIAARPHLARHAMDGLLMGVTITMVLVLPYFLPSKAARPTFGNWMLTRGGIALFGMTLGVGFKQSLGVVVPDSMRFMPMTFLILASMISCYIQFYGLMKLRPAK